MIRLSMKKVFAGDVGGTTTRLGVFEISDSRPHTTVSRTYSTRDFPSIPAMATAFLREEGIDPRSIDRTCFGAAGPVLNGVASLTNTPVRVEAAAIARALGIATVLLLNDLEALAYAVPVLSPAEVHVLQEGRANPE